LKAISASCGAGYVSAAASLVQNIAPADSAVGQRLLRTDFEEQFYQYYMRALSTFADSGDLSAGRKYPTAAQRANWRLAS
jgi:hypothetical protein